MRRLAVLSGGFMAGQLLILLTSPLLSRLFTPVEFGVYGVLTALNGIFGNVLSMRYELGVPLARSAQDAAALIKLAIAMVVATCLAMLPLIWLGGDAFARATEMPLLTQALWLLPIVVVAHSAGETLSYWSIYRGTFRLNATSRMFQSVVQAGSQLGLGLLAFHAWGLMAGFVLGCLARTGYLALGIARADRRRIARASPARMLRLARQHWQYPAYSAPASFLEAGTQLLPVVLLAMLFGPVYAGLFGFAQRLMGLPLRLFAQAARQVFLGEAATRHPKGLYRLFMRSSLLFLGMGILGLTPLLLAGPQLFAFVFGEAWRPAGEMVQLLVPLYATRLVVTPISQALNIVGRQSLHLVSSMLDAALMLATFTAAWWLTLPPMRTVLLFSLGSTTAYLLYFVLAWHATRAHMRAAARTDAEPQPLTTAD